MFNRLTEDLLDLVANEVGHREVSPALTIEVCCCSCCCDCFICLPWP